MADDPHTAAVRLLELSGKATAGPWTMRKAGWMKDGAFDFGVGAEVDGREHLIAEAFGRVADESTTPAEANADLIAAARNDLPAICEALLRMEAALRWYAEGDRYDFDNDCIWDIPQKRQQELSTPEEAGHVLTDQGERARVALSPRTPHSSCEAVAKQEADGET